MKKKMVTSEKTNGLVIMGHSKYKMQYGFEISNWIPSFFDTQEPIMNSTWMFIESQRHHKLLITNCHPNNKIFGRFLKHKYLRISRIDLDREVK